MLRRTLLPLVIASLLLVGMPAAVAQPAYQGFGCITDPEGDTADPRADLLELCVRYFPSTPAAVVFSMQAAAPFDPLNDDAWTNPNTAAAVGFSTDGDDQVDRIFTVSREEDRLVGEMTDADGTPIEGCGEIAEVVSGFLRGQFNASCIDDAEGIRVTGTLTIEPSPGTAVSVDVLPDDGLSFTIPRRDESPVCANATVESSPTLTVQRLACGVGGTEPISQGVATSQFVFDRPETAVIDPYQAEWVVLARDDDFADALAGSSLSFGQGPLLFTYSPASAAALDRDPNELAAITRAEILRTLPRGRKVYLLGGENALAPGLDTQLTELGYEVVRFAGVGRENTARMVALEVRDIVEKFSERNNFPDTRMAFVVNARNWPDAVLAGSVGAYWGMPILLTNEDSVHPETRAALEEMDIDYIHVAGGQTVVPTPVLQELRTFVDGRQEEGVDLNDPESPYVAFCRNPEGGFEYGCRWGGGDRVATASFVAQLNRDMLRRFGATHPSIPADQQAFAAAINLRAPQAFTWALSAATVSGRFGGAVFIPAEGDAGTTLRDDTKAFSCPYIQDIDQVVLVGDTDVISPEFVDQLRAHHADPTTADFDPPCIGN